MNATGAIVLAAGNSSRLGEPKQLLQHQGETLIRQAARAALNSGCKPVCVVIGAVVDQIENALADLEVRLVRNAQWARGLGTSIQCGVEACLATDPTLAALAVPRSRPARGGRANHHHAPDTSRRKLPRNRDRRLRRDARCSGHFLAQYFPKLCALPAERGAKHLLQSHSYDIAVVSFQPACKTSTLPPIAAIWRGRLSLFTRTNNDIHVPSHARNQGMTSLQLKGNWNEIKGKLNRSMLNKPTTIRGSSRARRTSCLAGCNSGLAKTCEFAITLFSPEVRRDHLRSRKPVSPAWAAQ